MYVLLRFLVAGTVQREGVGRLYRREGDTSRRRYVPTCQASLLSFKQLYRTSHFYFYCGSVSLMQTSVWSTTVRCVLGAEATIIASGEGCEYVSAINSRVCFPNCASCRQQKKPMVIGNPMGSALQQNPPVFGALSGPFRLSMFPYFSWREGGRGDEGLSLIHI